MTVYIVLTNDCFHDQDSRHSNNGRTGTPAKVELVRKRPVRIHAIFFKFNTD